MSTDDHISNVPTADIISSAPATSTQSTESVAASTTDPVATLVGEGKKFKDVSALAAGKLESDRFIEQLQREAADMRAQLAVASDKAATQHTLTEVLEALNQRPEGANSDGQAQGTPPKTVTLEDITRLVKATNAAEKAIERANANRTTVNRKLMELAGGDANKARDLLATRSAELGLTSAQIRDMSEKSPTALIELLAKAPSSAPQSTTVPASHVNSEALLKGAQASGERKLSYYTAKRREMGMNKFYNDAVLQAQYAADMVRHGESFIDNTN